ncbi:iron permease [Campylobacter sp. MIT 99-7217]|uniref:FTR1 family iron permease n=1 Tax=Campylobacter sp. MIT 99-7217 TaxID=535091 RepID=UPI00115771E3|nr:FTR1 family protein [Campylobacter sp. MIT 99-7217]TQR29520.1 iron permease [Campylobacter sp. MIT 99-7217]
MKKSIFAVLLFCISLAFGRVDDYIAEAEIIKNMLNESVKLYENGDAQGAKKKAEDAYFQHFENMEGAVGRNIGRKAITMERKFTNLRRMYKDGVELKKVKALVEGLNYDLDEVAPIVQNGFRLVAEASDENYDKKAAELSSLEAEKKRQAEAEALIASMMGTQVTSQSSSSEIIADTSEENLNTSSKDEQSSNLQSKSDQEVIANLQSAASIDVKLQFLIDNISTKFNEAASNFKAGNLQEAKDLLNSALFEDYRNSKAEVAVSGFTKAGSDQKIQQGIRSVITKINNNEFDEKTLRASLEELEDQIFDAFLQIPQEQIALIKVEGFNENSATNVDYSKIADDLKIAFNNILDDYQGFNQASIDALQSAYLDIFEASGMEYKIGAVDSSLKLKIEGFFTQGLALIKQSAPKEELSKNFDTINSLVSGVLDKIQESSPFSLFIWAFGILLREGLEALIIVVAIVSYLIQSGNKKSLNIAYSALFTGIILSFITAFLVSWIFKSTAGQNREILEGVTMIVAVFFLFYVGFWLLSRAGNEKWANFIKKQTIDSISQNSSRMLWITVFLAVYREGAETVLFYQALFIDAKTSLDYMGVFSGLILGCLVIVILYFLLKAGALKIPTKQFFYITAYIIFYMVFVFTGKAVGELIMGKVVSPTLIPISFDPIDWLGIYPYYESIIPQTLVLILLVTGIFITHKITKKRSQ